MRLVDLPPESLERIRAYRWDRIIEKHEGPERWSDTLEYGSPDFLTIEGRQVLLPVDAEQHARITVLRCIASQDGSSLTIFLRDTTYGDDWWSSGYLAVCDQVPGEAFFLAIVYHEWFTLAAWW